MHINFRQGIVTYPGTGSDQKFLTYSGGNVTLVSTATEPVRVVFAHHASNYLLTEPNTVNNAWTGLPTAYPVWLYWDIDTMSGTRTFGFTEVAPTFGVYPPQSPVDNQHWFNITTGTMNLFSRGSWRVVIRAFAARLSGTTFSHMATHPAAAKPYAGSQVQLNTPNVVGEIVRNQYNVPYRRADGRFFTTQDYFFVNNIPFAIDQVGTQTLVATADAPLAAYHVVKVTEPDHINYAGYNDLQNSFVAILTDDLNTNEVGTIIATGVITNTAWRWTDEGAVPGSPLWVGASGRLVVEDPHVAMAVDHPIGYSPVARVINNTTIYFDQGLGGKGDKGDRGEAGTGGGGGNVTVDPATTTALGVVRITASANNPASPIAVSSTDPKYVNALDKTGDTMSGRLTLSDNPILPMHAATKQYVDNRDNKPTTLTGDVTGSGTGTISTTLSNTGVEPGVYATANVTVDAKGRITYIEAGEATGGSGGTEWLVELSDVDASRDEPYRFAGIESGIVRSQALQYDGESDKWINASVAALGGHNEDSSWALFDEHHITVQGGDQFPSGGDVTITAGRGLNPDTGEEPEGGTVYISGGAAEGNQDHHGRVVITGGYTGNQYESRGNVVAEGGYGRLEVGQINGYNGGVNVLGVDGDRGRFTLWSSKDYYGSERGYITFVNAGTHQQYTEYSFPHDGKSGQILTTDGYGYLQWKWPDNGRPSSTSRSVQITPNDRNKTIMYTGNSDVMFTIAPDGYDDEAYEPQTTVYIMQRGNGQVGIDPGNDITLIYPDPLTPYTMGMGATIAIRHIGHNMWSVVGQMAAVEMGAV